MRIGEVMENTDAIRLAVERNAKAVALRPSVGQNTAKTLIHLKPGLACEVVEGQWTFAVGMSPKSGGSDAGPNPGVLGRAALGSCLAIGYAMWAARMDVPIDALDVEVEADYDSRGELGVDDSVPPGYSQVRCIVSISSPASDDEVRKLVETADKYSPYLDVFRRAHDVRRELRLGRGPGTPA
jgi:uncharacterized OsmC-like protein